MSAPPDRKSHKNYYGTPYAQKDEYYGASKKYDDPSPHLFHNHPYHDLHAMRHAAFPPSPAATASYHPAAYGGGGAAAFRNFQQLQHHGDASDPERDWFNNAPAPSHRTESCSSFAEDVCGCGAPDCPYTSAASTRSHFNRGPAQTAASRQGYPRPACA